MQSGTELRYYLKAFKNLDLSHFLWLLVSDGEFRDLIFDFKFVLQAIFVEYSVEPQGAETLVRNASGSKVSHDDSSSDLDAIKQAETLVKQTETLVRKPVLSKRAENINPSKDEIKPKENPEARHADKNLYPSASYPFDTKSFYSISPIPNESERKL